MQVVVDAYVDLSPWSEDNDFGRNFSKRRAEKAKEDGAMMICTDDHNFLMEQARQRTTLDYEDTVYGELDEDEASVSDDEGDIEEEDSEGD